MKQNSPSALSLLWQYQPTTWSFSVVVKLANRILSLLGGLSSLDVSEDKVVHLTQTVWNVRHQLLTTRLTELSDNRLTNVHLRLGSNHDSRGDYPNVRDKLENRIVTRQQHLAADAMPESIQLRNLTVAAMLRDRLL
ncbi:MAG TPA: hypothetical protein VMW24_09150 [Sedimentisphaerales bacterium]|nr:hypothetical protein [Sedimentisphaerales bacterium]